MPGPIGQAFVQVRADTSKLSGDVKDGMGKVESTVKASAADIEASIKNHFSDGINSAQGSLREIGSTANTEFGQVSREAKTASDKIGSDFQSGGEKAENALEEVGDKGKKEFDRIEREAKDASDAGGHHFGAMAAGITGALAGIGFGALISSSVSAANESAAGMAKLQQIITSTGGAAGFTADQMASMATDLSFKIGVDDDDIIAAEGVMSTFRNVSGDTFTRATALGADMASVFGGDLSSASMRLGKALNDPTKGISALSKVGVTFTAEQKEQIKAMQAAGDMAGAQAIILDELQNEVGGAAEASATGAQKMSVAFGEMKESLGGGIASALDVAAPAMVDLMTELQAPLEDLGKSLGTAIGPLFDALGPALADLISGLSPVFDGLSSIIKTLAPLLDPLVTVLTTVGGVMMDGLVAAFDALKPAITIIVPFIGQLGDILGGVLSSALTAITPALTTIGQIFGDTLAVILPVILDMFTQLSPIIAEIAGILGDTLAAALPPIVDAFTMLFDILGPIIPLLADGLLWVLKQLEPVLPLIVDAFIAWKVAMAAWNVITRIATALQLAWNAVMDANPIVLVVAAIVALGAAAFLAYKKFKPFHDLVDRMWQSIQRLWDVLLGLVRGWMVQFHVVERVKLAFHKFFLVLKQVWTTIKHLVDVVGKTFVKAWRRLLAVLPGVVDAVKNFLKTNAVVKTVVDFFKREIQRWIDIGKSVIDFFKNIFHRDFSAALQNLKDIAGTVIAGIIDRFKTFGPLVLAGLGKLADLLVPKGKELINGLWQGIQSVWDSTLLPGLKALPGLMLQGLGAAASFLGKWGGEAARGLWSFFKSTIQPLLGTLISNLPGWIGSGLSALASWAVSAATGLWNAFKTHVAPLLGTLISNLPGWIGSGLTALASFAKDLGTGLWNFFTTRIKPLLGSLIAKLPGWIGEALGVLAEWGKDLGTGLWNVFTERIVPLLGSLIAKLPGWIGDALGALAQWAKDLGTGLWNVFTDRIVPLLGSLIGKLPGWIGDALGALAGWALDLGTGLWNVFTQRIVPLLGTLITKLPGWIGEALGALGGWAWDLATGLWNVFTQRIVPLMASIITKLPGWIGTAVSAIGGWAWDMATGLWNVFTQRVVPLLGSIITKLPGWIGDAAVAIGGWARSLGTKAWDFFSERLSGLLGTLIGKIPGWIGDLADTGATWIHSMFNGIRDWILNDAPGWVKWIAEHIFGLSADDMPDNSTEYSNYFQQQMADADFSPAREEIKKGLTGDGVLSLGTTDIDGNFQVSNTGIDQFIQDMGVMVGTTGADHIRTAITDALANDGIIDPDEMTAILSTFQDALADPNNVKPGAHALGQNLGNSIAESADKYVPLALRGVTPYFKKAPADWATEMQPGAFNSLQLPASLMMDGLRKSVTDGIGKTTPFLKQAPTTFADAVNQKKTALKMPGSDLITGFREAINSTMLTVKLIFTGLTLNILSWVGNLKNVLKLVGAQLIGGFNDGIQQEFVKVTSFLKGVPLRIIGAIGSTKTTLHPTGVDLMSGLSSGITAGGVLVQNSLDRVLGKATTFKDKFVAAFTAAVAGVQSAFGRLDDVVRGPVNAVIGFYNSGIRSVWNAIVSKIPGIGSLGTISYMAEGGRVPGVGNRDTVPAMLTPGEFVITKEAAKLIGSKALYAINEGKGTLDPGIFGYRTGGYARSADETLKFARQQVGKPYLFAATGPGSFDCSGFTSALINYILGKSNPFVRRHSSGSMGSDPALAPGVGDNPTMGGLFGARPPYMRNHLGDFVGHTAATLAGVNMEATPPAVRMGNGSRGARSLPDLYHLPGWGGLSDADKTIVREVRSLLTMQLSGLGAPMGDMLEKLGNQLPPMVYDFAVERLPPLMGDAIANGVDGYAFGGMVPGQGPRLAVVHGGEQVLTPEQQGGTTITFGPGSVAVTFTGATPTAQQAFAVGTQVGQGIASVMEQQRIRTQARVA